jgi:hypothetical protein
VVIEVELSTAFDVDEYFSFYDEVDDVGKGRRWFRW